MIQLIQDIDQLPWDLSQSGRRKQVKIYFLKLNTFFFLIKLKLVFDN